MLTFGEAPQPRDKYKRLDLALIGAELIEHRGEWAVIDKGPYERLRGRVFQWRTRGVPARMPAASYEFEVRRVEGKSKARLYARAV